MGKISSVRITSPEKVRGRRFTLFVKMRWRDERLAVQARGREGRARGNGLEIEHGNADLLAFEGRLRPDPRGSGCPAG